VGPARGVEVVDSGPQLGRPNGIAWDAKGRRWLVASFDPFDSRVFVLGGGGGTDTSRTPPRLAQGIGRWDGLEVLADGRILVSSWSDSSVHLIDGDRDRRIVRDVIQPADIGVDTRRTRVAIPLALQSRLEIWTLPPR
jgi:sugar lactone lactonase YvrE